jgi:hypothetical protein
LEVCDDSSRLTFQVLASADVLYAKTSVSANIAASSMSIHGSSQTVTTHILKASFKRNLVQSRFDGYFYMVGSTLVTLHQTSSERTWMAIVDYFPPGVPPQISNGVLINQAESKAGYLTFSAMQGRVSSGLSLMVDFSNDDTGHYAAVPPSKGGTIVPQLARESGTVWQEAAYTWGNAATWDISGFSMDSALSASLFEAIGDKVATIAMTLDTELSIDTNCHADAVHLDLTRSYVCPLLNTTTTTTTTVTSTTSTSVTSSTTNTTTSTTSTTIVTTSTITTTYAWPPIENPGDRSGLATLIKGSLTMQVPNADFFLLDNVAQLAVAAGIAAAVGVPSNYVTVVAAKLRRLAIVDLRGRRLAQIVQIDYVIKLPSTVSGSKKQSTIQRAISVTEVELTASIQTQVELSKGDTFLVIVMSKAMPVTEMEQESMDSLIPTTRRKGESDGANLRASCGLWQILLPPVLTAFALT